MDYIEYRVDDGAIETAEPGDVVTIGTDGVHKIETRATDLADNTSNWRPQTLRIDRTQPLDTSGPACRLGQDHARSP